MKKHAIIFASLALSCLVLSAPLSAGAVSSSQTEASSLYIITVQPELPVTERSELELTALEMTQTWQNPNPRRQLALSLSPVPGVLFTGGAVPPRSSLRWMPAALSRHWPPARQSSVHTPHREKR